MVYPNLKAVNLGSQQEEGLGILPQKKGGSPLVFYCTKSYLTFVHGNVFKPTDCLLFIVVELYNVTYNHSHEICWHTHHQISEKINTDSILE